VSYSNLNKVVARGTRILIDDGLVEMQVMDINEREIMCKVLNSGPIKDRKSLNVPGVKLDMSYLSQKDEDDIQFAIDNDFDYIAASFTRSADDIIEIRNYLEENGGSDIQIIAKTARVWNMQMKF
jgi:pyruvate kinase